MVCKSYKASAPGSVMLMGEHAVLHGEPALVAAVDKYIHVKVMALAEKKIIINSALADIECDLNNIKVEKPLQFVLQACRHFQKYFKNGFCLQITSEFSHEVGLGSSAAVTVGTVAALSALLEKPFSLPQIFDDARQIMLAVQGRGSGADVAASVYGNIVYYKMQPLVTEVIDRCPQIMLAYCGYKTPTVTVIEKVQQLFAERMPQLQAIYADIGRLVEQAKIALENQDTKCLGQLFKAQQRLMCALHLQTSELETLIQQFEQQPEVYGAKISGSGLGDCVIAVGEFLEKLCHTVDNTIAVTITKRGVFLNE